MDELKMLIDMVAALPAMAMWVLVGFFAYKVVVVGSIYGLVRFVVDKLHSWLTGPPRPEPPGPPIQVDGLVGGISITGCAPAIIEQIKRIRGKGLNIHSPYIHSQSVDWLREAIDEKEMNTVLDKAKAKA